MLSGKRILIVEEQFLVALDMQRILEDTHAAQAIFTRTIEEAHSLKDRWGEFDLAIIEVQTDSFPALALARALHELGVAVVLTSADDAYRRGFPGFSGIPVVSKPFAENDLLEACATALADSPNGAAS